MRYTQEMIDKLIVMDRLKYSNFKQSDLNDINLSNLDLSGISFRGANFVRANLENAILIDADLFMANLFGANLKNATLKRANLKFTCLHRANLKDADLTDTNIEYCCGNGQEIITLRTFRGDGFHCAVVKDPIMGITLAIGSCQFPLDKWKNITDKELCKYIGIDTLCMWDNNKKFIFNEIDKHFGAIK